MIDLTRHAEPVLSRLAACGGDLAEIFLEHTDRTVLQFDDGKVEHVVSGVDGGAGLRLLAGDRTYYAHTNDVTEAGLLAAADTVAEAAAGAGDAPRNYDFAPQRYDAAIEQPPAQIPTARKAALAEMADKCARGVDPRVAQVSVSYADALRHIVVVNSEGRFVEDLRPQILLRIHVVAADGPVIQTGFRTMGGTLGFEVFDREDPEALARDAARQACLMLEADPAPTGRMPVVLSSSAGGVMIHEAVGHGLEADHIDKGMSKYRGRLGEAVAGPAVTIVDDGSMPERRGSAHVDDEGTPTQRTVLVDQGRLVRLMHDLRTARKMDLEPTGNGRRQSYEYKPVPRMTNTFVAPGQDDPAAVLEDTSSGLYVARMGGGQVNTLNGEFVFNVQEGYRIENGRAETPVRGALLIGNGPDALWAIEAVGRDLDFALGTCGKAGQGVPVCTGQPTLRLGALTIGGTAS